MTPLFKLLPLHGDNPGNVSLGERAPAPPGLRGGGVDPRRTWKTTFRISSSSKSLLCCPDLDSRAPSGRGPRPSPGCRCNQLLSLCARFRVFKLATSIRNSDGSWT
ncbi:hypothetical protein EVAR_36987_1 [Eumeta japonica]|uniref:Uncharacterized protein n=1 Tax=Eumeta variegata TaxID=151549 RepID=A0A4C1X0P5_EUMVA|nr:hypothetical protein EVAR_36987_1 [Eumeta japonica]